MTFFYDLNKKLDAIRETPSKTHGQLNERGEKWIQKAVDPSHKGDLHKALHVPQGEKIPKSKINKAAHSKDEHLRHMAQFAKNVAPKQEGVMDTVKSVGKKVASGVNKLVGHGSDEEMRKDLQRKVGVPATGQKPQQQVKEKLSPAKQKSFAALAPPKDKITFADKIAGAKKEVDEMLGDVAAEAMRKALGGGKGRNAEMDEDNAFDYKSPRAAAPKVGSVERGHKHDIKHTATGRMVTRRTDDQGNSVGADDDTDTQAGPRGRGRPKGTKGAIGAKGPSGKSKLMTREGDTDPADQGEYDQEGEMAKDDIKTIVRHAQALQKILGDNDNLPEWVQSKLAKIEGMMISIDEYMQNQDGEEQELDEKAVSKQQQKFMGMVHAAQKGEKPASKEVAKVAKTMKKKDAEDFASTKHKGLPEKAPKKKKEEEVEESGTTAAGSVAPSTATKGSKGSVIGKGIYDSMNFELEQMIAESMSINMSDSTEGGKSLTITATDEDALKLGMMLKAAGLGGGDEHGDGMHSHGEESCPTCGMEDCGCGDVEQAIDENAPDWPTNTEKADNNFGYAGGLSKPKASGMATIPVTDVQIDGEDKFGEIARLREMAGIDQAELEPWKETMKEEADDTCSDCHKDPCECEESVEESIRRMKEIAGIKEAKKPDYLDFDKDGDKKEPMTKALKDKEEKKVEESIFALTNQWKAYRG